MSTLSVISSTSIDGAQARSAASASRRRRPWRRSSWPRGHVDRHRRSAVPGGGARCHSAPRGTPRCSTQRADAARSARSPRRARRTPSGGDHAAPRVMPAQQRLDADEPAVAQVDGSAGRRSASSPPATARRAAPAPARCARAPRRASTGRSAPSRPRAAAFARYIARSALRSSAVGVVAGRPRRRCRCCCGRAPAPRRAAPGRRATAVMRRATSTALSPIVGTGRAGRRTRRRRGGRRVSPRDAPQQPRGHVRAAARHPTAWPWTSLTALKPSRSRNSTATRSGWRAGRAERLLDPLPEQRAVGQPGQRVVEGLVDQLALQPLAVADVTGVEHDAADVRVGEQVGHRASRSRTTGPRRATAARRRSAGPPAPASPVPAGRAPG